MIETDPLASARTLISEFERLYPGTIRLAETLSLAVRVEPAWLRKARLTLHPGLSASAEADLWFSPLVESSSARGFVFAPDVQQVLRDGLKKEPVRLQATWELLHQFHLSMPPVLALEEQVTWLTLAEGKAATPRVEQLLGQAVHAMLSSEDRGLGIARWAVGALQRLPKEARESMAAEFLTLGTVARVGGVVLQQVGALPKRIPASARRVLPASLEQVKVRLRWAPGRLVVLGTEAEGPAHEFHVPATTPVLLGIEWTTVEGDQQRLLIAEPGAWAALPENVSSLRLVALDGRAWEVSSQSLKMPQPPSREIPHPATGPLAELRARVEDALSRKRWDEAKALQRELWETTRRTLGEAHQETLRVFSGWVDLLQGSEELGEAYRLLELWLNSLRKTHGAEHPAILTLMNTLAELLRAQGDLEGARALQMKGWESALRVWGGEHPNTLTAMSNLASTLQMLGEFGYARELLQRALEIRLQTSGADDPETLTTLNNLAQVRRAQGAFDEALTLQEQALEGRRRVLGEEAPGTLTAMGNLAQLYWDLGRYSEARALLERFIPLMSRVLGEHHPISLGALETLAAVLQSQGDFPGAREQLERIVAAKLRLLGQDHPETLLTIANLAEVLRAQGALDQARTLQQETLRKRMRASGTENPDTLMLMSNMAETLRAQGDLGGALELQESALSNSRRLLGHTHPTTLTLMNNLAGTLRARGDLARAGQLQEEALEGRRQQLGPEHPATLNVSNNLAITLGIQGEHERARNLLEHLLDVRRRSLGETHPDTIDTMKKLAWLSEQKGDFEQARSRYEQVLELETQRLGEHHPSTEDTRDQLLRLNHEPSDPNKDGKLALDDDAPPDEADEEHGVPTLEQVQAALFQDFLDDFPSELDELSSHTELDDVVVHDLEKQPSEAGTERFNGSGEVSVVLHYGGDDDEVRSTDYYPFTFTVEQDAGGGLTVIEKKVNTSSFYAD